MSKYTAEQIAAAQASIRRKPDNLEAVDVPYAGLLCDRGHEVPLGQKVFRWVSNHPGGPMDAYAVNRKVEYHYRCVGHTRLAGWLLANPEQLVNREQDAAIRAATPEEVQAAIRQVEKDKSESAADLCPECGGPLPQSRVTSE
jgi:hypothetical protein